MSRRRPAPKLGCPRNPCSSCPYRKDTPPGIWAAEEYRKLPLWDDPLARPGTFLCHHSGTDGRERVCRGWLEVHSGNIGVRILMASGMDTSDPRWSVPTRVPLYASGAEACAAGLRGVASPGRRARDVMVKLTVAKRAAARRRA